MIKRLLLGLFVFIGLGLSFTSATFVFRQNGSYGYSTLDNSIDLNVFNKGQLGSQRFGNTKRMLALTSKAVTNNNGQVTDYNRIFFFWGNNAKPYYLVSYDGKKYQGFLKTYYLCDEITSVSSNISSLSNMNCSSYSLTDNFSIEMGGFFDSITIDDYWGYNVSTWNCYGNSQLVNQICFSSSAYNKSVCFSAGGGLSNSQCGCTDCNNVQNSLGLSYSGDFTQIQDGYLSTPPGFQGGGNLNTGGSSSSVSNSVITGNVMYEDCTIGKVVNYYNNLGYSKNLCYAGIPLNTSGFVVPIAGTGADYLDLYISMTSGDNSDMSLMQWFTYWRNTFTQWNNGSSPSVNNPFTGYDPALYSYFGFVEKYGVAFSNDKIIDYCFMLDEDLNSLYVGSDFALVCSQSSDSAFYLGDNGSGGVIQGNIVGSDWSGIFSGSNKDYSFVGVLNEFFNKLTTHISQLNTSDVGLGILPTYIITVLLGLILFRFLSH